MSVKRLKFNRFEKIIFLMVPNINIEELTRYLTFTTELVKSGFPTHYFICDGPPHYQY